MDARFNLEVSFTFGGEGGTAGDASAGGTDNTASTLSGSAPHDAVTTTSAATTMGSGI
jgi:hypothetical protein